MFIKATFNNAECLLNTDYIVDIFNADKWVADVYVLDIDRDCYKVKQSEIQKLLHEEEPQTEEKHAICNGCVYCDLPNAFHPCASCVDFSKYVGEESGDTPQTDCKGCIYENGDSLMACTFCQGKVPYDGYEPQTDCGWR